MASMNDQIIETFRANAGVVGGHFEGNRLVVLHYVGRRSGQERVTPLVAAGDGDSYLVSGSADGADEAPLWVANVEAGSGETTIEVGDRTVRVKTTVVRSTSPQWQRLYGAWKAYWPVAAQYETRTSRRFPIVRLDPVA